MIEFKNEEGYHRSTECKLDHELKENVYKFVVTTKRRTGSEIRRYNVLASEMDKYKEELEKDPEVKILY